MIYKIIEKLRNTSSTNEKLNILRENKDNELLKKIFYYAYNPRYRFGIKNTKQFDFFNTCHEQEFTLEDCFNHLDKLRNRELTGNKALSETQNIIHQLTKDDYDLLIDILDKDLKCGVSVTTLNKVWGKSFIPEQPQMLCVPMNDKNLSRIKYPAFAQLKADGARCFIDLDFDNHIITMSSRSGKEYLGFEDSPLHNCLIDLIDQFKLQGINNTVTLDGELLVYGEDGDIADRKTGNGILNKSLQGTIIPNEASNVRFVVWDIISQETIEKPYNERFDTLQAILKHNPESISLIENNIVNSLEEAKSVYRKYIEQGFEGIILKNMDSKWKDGRSNDQVKFKEELTADLEIFDLIQHKKNDNMLGSFMLKSKDNKVITACGSGLTDELRIKFWSMGNDLIGKIAEVKHNGLITNKANPNTFSLFLPIFIQIREDKSEANTLNEMQ